MKGETQNTGETVGEIVETVETGETYGWQTGNVATGNAGYTVETGEIVENGDSCED